MYKIFSFFSKIINLCDIFSYRIRDFSKIIFFIHFVLVLSNPNVIFNIISQNNNYNDELASALKKNIIDQYSQLQLNTPTVFISNKDFNVDGDWTITPLIIPILQITEPDTECIFFLEDRTNVSVNLLIQELRKYDFKEEIWIGHALYDSDATIIHHFAFHEDPTFFKYPYLGSGMIISLPLLKRLKTRIIENRYKKLDFHIDQAHEFALFVYDDGKGPLIQHNDMFCCKKKDNCATYPRAFETCGKADISSIYFAVKTCQKFHKDRVEVVKKTWKKYTSKTTFFSDYEDKNLPTISVNIKNTEQGHCEKTMSILKYTQKEFDDDKELQWLALVDDDTILSVSRIASLTTCYQNITDPLVMGERYRFGTQGFNYATGGAGVLINRAALKVLAQACICPKIDSPDDMVLGACADQFGIPLVHVPQMHQARPLDYAAGRLANEDAITFHKHWMIDPVETYHHWFEKEDYSTTKIDTIKTEL